MRFCISIAKLNAFFSLFVTFFYQYNQCILEHHFYGGKMHILPPPQDIMKKRKMWIICCSISSDMSKFVEIWADYSKFTKYMSKKTKKRKKVDDLELDHTRFGSMIVKFFQIYVQEKNGNTKKIAHLELDFIRFCIFSNSKIIIGKLMPKIVRK